MKTWVIEMLGKMCGATELLKRVAGSKTYVAGVGLILTGAGALCAQVVGVIDAGTLAAWIEFGKGLPTNEGFLAISAGLGMVGLKHSHEKMVVEMQSLAGAESKLPPTVKEK